MRHLHLSPPYDVEDHTNHIFSVRISSWPLGTIICPLFAIINANLNFRRKKHNKEGAFPGEIGGVGWEGGRQKMTARHISPCEAKVGAAAPIFVSGERPPPIYIHHPRPILSPNLSLISHQGQAPYSTLERGPLRPYRGANTPPTAFDTLSHSPQSCLCFHIKDKTKQVGDIFLKRGMTNLIFT